MIFPHVSGKAKGLINVLTSWKATGRALLPFLKTLGSGLIKLLNPMTYLKGGLNLVIGTVRMLISAITLLISPIGIIVAAITAGAVLIYANWEKVQAFFWRILGRFKIRVSPCLSGF